MRFSPLRYLKFPKTEQENFLRTKLPPLPPVSQLLKLYQIKATKHLSQNFLYEPRILKKFINLLGNQNLCGHYVCEIGPGPGSLTREILSREPESLIIIEKDHRFIPMLQYIADVCNNKLQIIHGDILRFDLTQAFPANQSRDWHAGELQSHDRQNITDWSAESPPLHICGNLPFNISLPLIFKLLSDISLKQGVFQLGRIPMVFTFQHEVGQRLIAQPGDPQRCRISVTSQYLCDTQYVFQIFGGSFVPAPKVDVAVVKMTPKKNFEIDLPFKTVDLVVKHAMHNRSKPSHLGIGTLFPPSRDDLKAEVLKLSGIDGKICGFQLDNLHFRDLCYAYESIAKRIPLIRKVDAFDKKSWLKFFDNNGDPIEADQTL